MDCSPVARYGFLLIFSLVLAAPALVRADDLPLADDCQLRLADKKDGAEAITKHDRYIQLMTPLDRRARLNADHEISTDEHLKFAAEQVQDWTDEDRKKLAAVITALRPKLQPWKLPLPATILLVKTSGLEESGAGYCRGPVIVLSQQMLAMPQAQLEQVFNHELFHVLSNQNPELQKELYASIGFEPCNDIELPPQLAGRKLTNPDAPDLSSYITLDYQGKPTEFVTLLMSRREKFGPEVQGGFLSAIEFKLLAIEKVGDTWRVKLVDGKPIAIDFKETPAYLEKVGRNTGYLIHPEEILADNFKLMTQGQKDRVPDPIVIQRIDEILKAAAKKKVKAAAESAK